LYIPAAPAELLDEAPDAVSRSRQPVNVTVCAEALLLRVCPAVELEPDGVCVDVELPWLWASTPTSAHAAAIETAVIMRFI
jgi:hypothetical protein